MKIALAIVEISSLSIAGTFIWFGHYDAASTALGLVILAKLLQREAA